MKNYYSLGILGILLFISSTIQAATRTWLGTTSSNWSVASNWSGSSVPGAGDRALINNPSAPNACTLTGNVTVNDLEVVSGATLNFAGFTITVTDDTELFGAVLNNASIAGTDYVLLRQNTFNGATFLSKSGANADDTYGGNVFNGTLTVVHNDNSRWRFSNTLGDTYNGAVSVSVTSTGDFQMCHRGTNTFNANLTIGSSTNGDFSLGQNDGTITFASGTAILSSGWTNGDILFESVTQLGTAANGSFSPVNFTAEDCIFGGSITTTSSSLTLLNNSNFTATNNFTGARIDVQNGCDFSTVSGTTTFTKTSSGNDDWQGGNVFGNVIVINNGTGRLRLSDTSFDTYQGSATFRRQSTGALQPAYDGNNIFQGDISTVGGTSAIIFGEGNGRIVCTGGNAQTFSGSSSLIPSTERLTINKSANDLTLNVPLIVLIDIVFTNRYIVSSSSNYIQLEDAITMSGVSNNSYVAGPVRKVGNDVFTFPIGGNGFYAPIGISAPANIADHFTAEYISGSPNAFYSVSSLGAGINHVGTCEYWNLDRTGGTSSVFVTLHWNNSRCGTVVVTPDLLVSRWNGTQWESHGIGTVTGTAAAGTIRTASAISTFSPFVLASSTATNQLPIELISFEAAVISDNQVQLEWATASERNNDFFTIEKSKDGQNWEVVTTVEGAGNSINRTDYVLVDKQPYAGLSYYRLKQTDYDGKFEYFDAVSVFVESSNEISVYPVPTSALLYVRGDVQKGNTQLISLSGEKMTVQWISSNESESINVLDVSRLAPGVYFLIIDGVAEKFVVE